jgi:hypothetical protein
MVNAFGRKKKGFMNPWKVNYSPSRKDQNRIRNAEIHASNDGNIVELGIQRYRLHTKPTAAFYESI